MKGYGRVIYTVNEEMLTEEKRVEFIFKCPEIYKDRLFLTPKDMQEILMLGESLTYAYLKNAPFRTEKVGAKILIFSNSFWDWYKVC